MRILALMTTDWYCLSLGGALESLGHEVQYLPWISPSEMDERVATFKPDFVLDMGWDYLQSSPWDKSVLKDAIERLNLYHVYFAEEDPLHFENFSKPYVQEIPTHFVMTRGAECVARYQELGFKATYLDVGVNSEFHRPVPPDPAYRCDISVIANVQIRYDIYRRKAIQNLVVPLFDQPYRMKIWGRDWEHAIDYYGKAPAEGVHLGRLPYAETPKVYNSAKINICLQSVEDQLSNRTYDILASGGFLLTGDTPAVRSLMTPGVHCEVSSSPEETLEKVAFYVAHDDARQKISQAGYELFKKSRLAYQETLPAKLELIRQELGKR